jgi:uncharacterized membrane protein affecting hemolysin expression
MVCLRNISVNTLHKGDTEDDDDMMMIMMMMMIIIIIIIIMSKILRENGPRYISVRTIHRDMIQCCYTSTVL